jgi:hypothetical protein
VTSDESGYFQTLHARRASRGGSGFFYTPFLSRNRGIQFYGFRVRAVQDA